MSELIGAAQDAFPVFRNGFHIHIDKIGGNGVVRAGQPEKSPHPPFKPMDVSDNAIREELKRILDSPEFKNKPMLCGFLSHVVEKTLAGRAHEIKGYTVATEVFSRRQDFDPTIDPIVRIQAGRLRRILESYYSGPGRQDQLKIEIGKGSYVPVFSRLSPKKQRLLEREETAETHAPELKLSRETDKVISFTAGTDVSLAVMPLVNLTGNPDHKHLAYGLAEELMSELARYPGLQLNVSYSKMQWKGKQIGTREVGRNLGVRFYLEGSLRQQGQIVKFTLRLIDTSTLLQVWGEQYKRNLEPGRLIDLQEEIARSVADKIGGLLAVQAKLMTGSNRCCSLIVVTITKKTKSVTFCRIGELHDRRDRVSRFYCQHHHHSCKESFWPVADL